MGAPLPTTLQKQPVVPGNGCICQCLGGKPPPVDINKIVAAGGKYAQAEDGRIIEYYIYGSDKADARVLLQIAGSGGTGRIFPRMKGVVDILLQQNIKGISISLPGNGLTSIDPKRKIGDWPNTDMNVVFEQEGITGEFMVEGTSFGTSHALAVMHAFPDRVSHVHLHVPYLPVEIRVDKGWAKYGADDMFKCGPSFLTSCDPRNLCIFCCCTMLFFYCGAHTMAVDKKLDAEAGYEVSKQLAEDIKHCTTANAVHGNLYNSMVKTIGENWGFDPRLTDCSKMRILVSYNDADESSPTEHGAFLAELYSTQAAKCQVSIGNGPHSAQMGPWARGVHLTQLLQM